MLQRITPPTVISAGANTATGTVVLSNSNGISVGLNGKTVTFSHNGLTSQSTAPGAIAAGTQTATSGTVLFSNSNGISFGMSGSTRVTATYTVPPSFSGGVSNLGNTAGSTGVSGTRLVLVGSQNITLSQSTDASGATVSFSGGAGAAGNTGFISAGAATASLGTVVLSNSNGVSAGVNGQTVTFSHNGLTSQSTQYLALTLGGNTAGTTTFHATNNATIFLNGGNNVTLSGNGSTVTISAANQTVQTQGITGDQLSIGVSTGGNTSGNTTVNNGQRFVLVGTNGITLSQGTGAGSTTVTISGITQSNQSAVKGLGVSNTGNTAGNTGLSTGIDWVVAGTNGITASQSTAGGGPNTIWISGITQSNQSAIKAFGVSNTGNTAGNTGVSTGIDWVIAGTNNVTVSQSTAGGGPNTIWLSAAAGGGGNFSAGASNLGNTAGNTGITGTRLVLVGTNNITLSQATDANGGTISISGAGGGAGQFSAGLSNLGNTGGNTGVTGTRLVFSANGAMSLSQTTDANGGTVGFYIPATSSLSATGQVSISTNGSTISIGVPLEATMSEFDPNEMALASMITNSTLGQNTIYFEPFDLPDHLSAYRLNLYVSVATGMSAANSTGRAGYTISAALYTRGTGASTDRLSSFWSGSAGISATQNSNSQLVMTNLAGISNSTAVSTVGTSISATNASTYMATSVGGFRAIPLPLSSTLTPGRYWLAVANSSASSNAGVVTLNCSVMQWTSVSNYIAFRPFGTNSAASNVSWPNLRPGLGTYTASSAGFPGSVALTTDNIRAPVVSVSHVVFNISAYTTGTNVL